MQRDPIGDILGTLFWILAAGMFSAPVWVPIVAFVVGVLVGGMQ